MGNTMTWEMNIFLLLPTEEAQENWVGTDCIPSSQASGEKLLIKNGRLISSPLSKLEIPEEPSTQ